MRFKYLMIALSLFTVMSLMFISCEQQMITDTGQKAMAEPEATSFILPDDAVIESALLCIYITETADMPVTVHNVTEEWEELEVTWNNFGGAFDPDVIASFDVNAEGWAMVDISDIVEKWSDGDLANLGVLLNMDPSDRTKFHSSEFLTDAALRPKLVISYITGTETMVETIQRETDILGEEVADALIKETDPDRNFGNWDWLYAGGANGNRKHALLRFDLEPGDEDDCCTSTPGYWKTHSRFGPAPYDNTWDEKDGGAAMFMESDQSYYEVLWTSPSGGNAFYILAHAWIAAELNMIRGASVPVDVHHAFEEGAGLLDMYDDQLEIPKKSDDRDAAIMYAEILDDYNNGITGPGHCDDEETEQGKEDEKEKD